MTASPAEVDVLCVGHASYDLVFSVSRQPAADEKIVADGFVGCGGGPAANAAVTVSRLGFKSAFAGYLGLDLFGEKHWQELVGQGVDVSLVVRGSSPTPLSAVLVKPGGQRSLINYKGDTTALSVDAIDCSSLRPTVALFDGHEPHVSMPVAERARRQGFPTILDAGSVHAGTRALMDRVDYLVCSEKFAQQFAADEASALTRLAEVAPAVVITLGERGLIWRRGQEGGAVPAFAITAVDTTGAGDAFHGAFAAAVASGMGWLEVLRYSSAAGALCCTKAGARPGLPSREEHRRLLKHGEATDR